MKKNPILIKIREHADLKRQEVGKLLGVSYNAVANYETAYRWPDMKKARIYIDLAKKHGLKVSLDDIYSSNQKRQRMRKGRQL